MQEKNIHVDVAIVGAGTAGLNAMREVRNAGKSFVLIDHGPLGTTCARVGCMPSKAVLHAAALWTGHASAGATTGATADSLWLDARKTRDMLADGAANRARAAAGERLLTGTAHFVASNELDVDGRRVTANAIVIAAGSRPVVPRFLDEVRERVLTTDTLFDLPALPESVAILGLGAIGLEMGLALARLGVRVVAADTQKLPAGISDPEIGARALARFGAIDGLTLWLGAPATASRAGEGVSISNGSVSAQVQWILAALGRSPSLAALRLDAAGLDLDVQGRPSIDPETMRAGRSAIYFAGDISAVRPLQHEAADEGAIAGWNAARHNAGARFHRRIPLSIVFSDPDVISVGLPYSALDLERTVIGSAAGQSNGRSRVMHAEDNLVRIYAERQSGRLLGASALASRAEHLAHLLALAIQRGETAESLLEMPFYHPTVEEMVQSALMDIVKQRAATHDAPVGLRRADAGN